MHAAQRYKDFNLEEIFKVPKEWSLEERKRVMLQQYLTILSNSPFTDNSNISH
jgi:hypothetical protein